MKTGQQSPRDLMACVGEPSRFHLVQLLGGGARCVTDLARAVGLSQSCTTRHLQVLQRSHIVSRTRAGKRVMYDLIRDEPGLAQLLAWVHAEPAAASVRATPPRMRASAAESVSDSGHHDGLRADGNSRPKYPVPPALRMRSIAPPSTSEPTPEPEATPPVRSRRTDSLEDYLL
jgi:DNA-binding transcriptional ArsR family regulator